jgi:crossover junction endodeoxyribonuclease RusA
MIELELSWPASVLSPNSRAHWRTKARFQTTSHLAAFAETRNWLWRHHCTVSESMPVTLIFCPPDRRPRDLDNLGASQKWALDGVAKALGVNDKQFRPVTLDWGDVCKPGKVIVKIGAAS